MDARIDLTDEVTIVIPLHESARFTDVVVRNIDKLAERVSLIVSDVSEMDDTLAKLQSQFATKPDISWIGCRGISPGWVSHCNDLVERVSTRFLMILPHDDEIDEDYVSQCHALLNANSGLGGVVGSVQVLNESSTLGKLLPALPEPSAVARYRLRSNAYLAEWNLGILFRAMLRREAWRPLPRTINIDEWADMVWGYGLTIEWEVQQISHITYFKRYYDDSTHQKGVTEFFPRALPFLVREITTRLPSESVSEAVEELVDIVSWRTAEALEERTLRARLLEERVVALQEEIKGIQNTPRRRTWRPR